MELAAEAPKALAVARIPLDFLSGSSAGFRGRADAFLRANLRKGVPALFSSLRHSYKRARDGNAADAARVEVLGDIVEGFLAALREGAPLPAAPDAGAADGEAQEEGERPHVLLWSLFFSAQHLDMVGKHVRFRSPFALLRCSVACCAVLAWLGCPM